MLTQNFWKIMNNKLKDLPMMSSQDALVSIMVAVSASDDKVSKRELLSIIRIVEHLPIFFGYDKSRIKIIAQTVFDIFEEEDGLEALFGLIQQSLPERLFETAYALACDVAAADGMLEEIELRFLQEIRHELNIDRLHGAAIERAARARHLLDH